MTRLRIGPPAAAFKRRVIAMAALGAGISMLAGCAPWRIWTTASLANEARPYAAQPAQPTRRILVVGDSTAVGTGASGPLASLPGLIGQRHPAWHIDNLASNGARYADVAQQLERAAAGYDLVLVLAGGNDVIRPGTDPDEEASRRETCGPGAGDDDLTTGEAETVYTVGCRGIGRTRPTSH